MTKQNKTVQNENESVHTIAEFREGMGFGKKLEVGDVVIIEDIQFAEGLYGRVALLDTTEGRRYTGATALVAFCERLAEHPEYLPIRVEVAEATSAKGRVYQVFH